MGSNENTEHCRKHENGSGTHDVSPQQCPFPETSRMQEDCNQIVCAETVNYGSELQEECSTQKTSQENDTSEESEEMSEDSEDGTTKENEQDEKEKDVQDVSQRRNYEEERVKNALDSIKRVAESVQWIEETIDRLNKAVSIALEEIEQARQKNEQLDQQKHLNFNAIRYQCRSQVEALTRELLELDQIFAGGALEVKEKRKEQVARIDSVIGRAEALVVRANDMVEMANSLEDFVQRDSESETPEEKSLSEEEDTQVLEDDEPNATPVPSPHRVSKTLNQNWNPRMRRSHQPHYYPLKIGRAHV